LRDYPRKIAMPDAMPSGRRLAPRGALHPVGSAECVAPPAQTGWVDLTDFAVD